VNRSALVRIILKATVDRAGGNKARIMVLSPLRPELSARALALFFA
jgi:hypothetical protein